MTPELALSLSIASGLDDDDVADKAAWVAAQIQSYREVVSKRTVAVLKGETNMGLHDETIITIAKNVVERGAPAVFEKSAYIAAITKRAAVIRKDGETEAKAFTRAITEDEIGKTLYRASKVAPGREVEGDAPQDFVPRKPEVGPAGRRMQALADDHLRAHPELSTQPDGGKAAAYARVWTHPDNAALREKVKSEDLKKSLAALVA